MISTRELADYLDTLLDIDNVPDYPNALNGLQIENTGPVSRVAASVDFSTRSIEGAKRAGANFLIVHHGMFWPGLRTFTGPSYTRLHALIQNDIAVYAAHLPLDRHSAFGNNVLLSRELGLSPSGEFARYKDITIGVAGEADIPTADLVTAAERFASKHAGHVTAVGVTENRITRHWAICTGAGASSESLHEAHDLGIDTLIVGEGPHHTAVEAEELGIAVIYAGHYATETLGVQAVAQHVSTRFDLGWSMVDAPTGL